MFWGKGLTYLSLVQTSSSAGRVVGQEIVHSELGVVYHCKMCFQMSWPAGSWGRKDLPGAPGAGSLLGKQAKLWSRNWSLGYWVQFTVVGSAFRELAG